METVFQGSGDPILAQARAMSARENPIIQAEASVRRPIGEP
jgi:hypothetical protein